MQSAARVPWERFYYNCTKTEKKRHIEAFIDEGAKVTVTASVDGHSPEFKPSLTEKAVEIL